LRSADESVEIEAKRAEDVGHSILETISAFCNEPLRGGGYIVCGVALSNESLFSDYQVVGIADTDKLQRDLATRCRDIFNSPVRPQIMVERREGKNIVVAYIPEAQPHEKPIYIKSQGLPQGAYRRIGSTDQHCTDEDIALFYQYRDHKTFDETVIPDATLDDFDPQAIAEYRRVRAEVNPSATELSYSDEELLYALAATAKSQGRTCATLAGLMLFGRQASLRRHFPWHVLITFWLKGKNGFLVPTIVIKQLRCVSRSSRSSPVS